MLIKDRDRTRKSLPWHVPHAQMFRRALLSNQKPVFAEPFGNVLVRFGKQRLRRLCLKIFRRFISPSLRSRRNLILGTGHYLSPGVGGGGGFLGDHLIVRRTKGGISRNWEPKKGGGGSLKTLEGFRGGPLKFAWKMKTWGGITSVK